MACTKEDIERKRLTALQKINEKRLSLKEQPKSSLRPKYEPYANNSKTAVTQTTLSKVISGTVYLISEDRFEVNTSEFSDVLITIFKTIPSKNYDCAKRLWSFSLHHYEDFQSKVMQLRPNIVLGVIPQYVLNTVRAKDNSSDVDLSKIDQNLLDKLMPFQMDGVRFGIEKNGRCMIADDMGLGKTFQALAIANYYINDWPLLIVTTSTMRETWENKIHELLPSIPMVYIVCISSGKDKELLADHRYKVIIISYKMTTLCTDELIKKGFGCIILDESHLLKSPKAQNTITVAKIAKNAKRIILLTGTPALSRPVELFTQLKIIEPKFFQGYIEFGKRYCNGKNTNFGWDMSGQSHLAELQILLQKKFLIRRTKDQVLSSLKDKTRESIILNSSLLNITAKTKEGLSEMAQFYNARKSSDKHAALLSFFSESAKVKIPAIRNYIDGIIKEDKKFLVFAHHRNVLEAICSLLDEHRIHYINIDGSTQTSQRNALVEKFQFSDSCRCAVLSITAANAGITLTAAQLVIFAELHWNPGIITQAESRAHRIGQEGDVSIRYLLAKGTSDDFMWPMLEKKLQVLNQVGLSRDTFQNASLVSQSPPSSIEKYFNVSKRDLIPGTNIPVDSLDTTKEDVPIEDSFLDDNEGDELLASVDF